MIISDFILALWGELQRHIAELCTLAGALVTWVIHNQKKPRLKTKLYLDRDSCGIPSMVHISITNHGGSPTTINGIEGSGPDIKQHNFDCTYVSEKNRMGTKGDGPEQILAKQTLTALLRDGHIIAEGKISKLCVVDGCLKKTRASICEIQKRYSQHKA